MRGATHPNTLGYRAASISIHAPRAGRDHCPSRTRPAGHISIHAPRAGRDRAALYIRVSTEISIHAPRAGRDAHSGQQHSPLIRFQSTRPVRGATRSYNKYKDALGFQSTRPVRGATTAARGNKPRAYNFNPRAPCGARPIQIPLDTEPQVFQSTRPVRGATIVPAGRGQQVTFQSTRPVRGATR